MTDVGQHVAAPSRPLRGQAEPIGGRGQRLESATIPRPTPAPRRAARLVIARDGAWFRLGSGEPVDIARRRVLRNVLLVLARQRLRSPGLAANSADLFASAWPDQRIGRDSARNRLYVAINALRALGLRDALVRRADGYLIPPRIVLELR